MFVGPSCTASDNNPSSTGKHPDLSTWTYVKPEWVRILATCQVTPAKLRQAPARAGVFITRGRRQLLAPDLPYPTVPYTYGTYLNRLCRRLAHAHIDRESVLGTPCRWHIELTSGSRRVAKSFVYTTEGYRDNIFLLTRRWYWPCGGRISAIFLFPV